MWLIPSSNMIFSYLSAALSAIPDWDSQLTLRGSAGRKRCHPRHGGALRDEVRHGRAQRLDRGAGTVRREGLARVPLLDHRDRAVLGVVDGVQPATVLLVHGRDARAQGRDQLGAAARD